MAGNNSSPSDIAHLQERVRKLERQRGRQRRAFVALKAERDLLLQHVHALLRKQIPRETLVRWTQEEDEGIPLNEFIHELVALPEE